jgi:hypothetical protein
MEALNSRGCTCGVSRASGGEVYLNLKLQPLNSIVTYALEVEKCNSIRYAAYRYLQQNWLYIFDLCVCMCSKWLIKLAYTLAT